MNIELSPRQAGPKRKRRPVILIFWIALVLSVLISSLVWYLLHKPNDTRVDVFPSRSGDAVPAVFQGEIIENIVLLKEGEVLLALDWLQQRVDPSIFWDESSQSVVVTTEDKVLRMPNQQVEAFLNDKPFELRFPVVQEEDRIYVPFQPLDKIYPFQVQVLQDDKAVLIRQLDYPVQMGELLPISEKTDQVSIRLDASVKSPIVADLKAGDRVEIHGEKAGWYLVQTGDGISGFIDKLHVKLSGIDIRTWKPEEREKSFTAWNPLGGKINLTWEHVYSRNPDTGEIPPMPGVNVVSPTWFSLADEQGSIMNKADLSYVNWAHNRGYQVWALFSNNFDPDLTHAVLQDFDRRQNVIRQLVELAQLYELDGINIDFENVYLKDKQSLVQFVRELTPYLHEQDLVVSMDVTIKSQSERWSMFYDRKALADVVDYIMVMTYDEHWATTPKAGSVASLPWVENGLRGVLEEVPSHKLLLGIPFYTRLWTEARQEDGTVKVSSKAYSMPYIESWLKERGVEPVYDEKTGQMYAEYKDSPDVTYKVWLENETSIRQRLELVKKYDLAGIASWRRGFERADIWPFIKKEMEKRP
ncbi:MAG: SH3 domain-containing protein [Bacillaceae bacterium]|nr:SH3 domain-containing protein [Bacillaceae bacterium]